MAEYGSFNHLVVQLQSILENIYHFDRDEPLLYHSIKFTRILRVEHPVALYAVLTMTLEVIHERPGDDAFTPLSTHQSQTPSSFFSGRPVLHYHVPRAHVVTTKSHSETLSLSGTPSTDSTANPNAPGINGESHADAGGQDVVLSDVAVWVTSEYAHAPTAKILLPNTDSLRRFVLFNTVSNRGVSLPYPSISLHAIQRLRLPNAAPSAPEQQGLYLQVATATAASDEYSDEDTLELAVIPPPSPASSASTTAEPSADQSHDTEAQTLFAAVTACSNLHPDQPSSDADDDEDSDPIVFEGGVGYESGLLALSGSGLPPPMPGSGGWITAENVGEYFDEDANWKGAGRVTDPENRGALGPGAGTARERGPDDDEEEEGGATGDLEAADGEENKWRRTD